MLKSLTTCFCPDRPEASRRATSVVAIPILPYGEADNVSPRFGARLTSYYTVRAELPTGGDPVSPTRVPDQKLTFYAEELRHIAEFIISLCDQFRYGKLLQLRQVFLQTGVQQRSGGFLVTVGAAFRLRYGGVDAAQLDQVRGRYAQRLGRQFLLAGIAPHDGSATLGRDDGINRVLHHQNPVSDGDRQGTTAAPFSRDGGNDRHP